MSASRAVLSLCTRRTFAARALPAAYRVALAAPRWAAAASARSPAALAAPVRSFHMTCSARDGAPTAAKPVFLDKHEVLERVLTVVKNFEKIDPTKVTGAAKFKDDLGLDSLDTVEVVMAIEDEFGIVIPDDEADNMHSVEDAVSFIATHPNAH